jgi:cytochrome P450
MPIVTKLELPVFDYTDPAMVGERFHRTMSELRAQGTMALGPYGPIFLDRDSVEFFLRDAHTQTPGRPMAQMFALGDGVLGEIVDRNILNVDGPDHRRLRNLITPAFTPRAVAGYRQSMRTLFGELLAEVEQYGDCEFVSTFGKPYPSRVIASVLGAPAEDAERLHHWSHWIESQFDIARLVREREQVERAIEEAIAYTVELLARRRGDPGEDIISRLMSTGVEQDRLSDLELQDLVIGVLGGGVDSVQSQLAHMVRLFAEQPEQWQLLHERPELVPAAVEEVMRYEPMLPFTARILLEDTVHGDVELPAGSVVMLCIFTANREGDSDDEDLDRFDIAASRASTKPITFGVGPHYCLGSMLARAELEEALAQLSARFETLRLNGEPSYGSITGIYGLQRLPISFTTR